MTIPLTNMFDDSFENAYKSTPAGMAHLSGGGPDSRTCRECAKFHYDKGKAEYWAASNKLLANSLKPARCSKFKEMTKSKGDKFPASSRACKYFELSDNPHPATRLWRA